MFLKVLKYNKIYDEAQHDVHNMINQSCITYNSLKIYCLLPREDKKPEAGQQCSVQCTFVSHPEIFSPPYSQSTFNMASDTVYQFTVKDIDGKDVSLERYRGHVLCIVNVASK